MAAFKKQRPSASDLAAMEHFQRPSEIAIQSIIDGVDAVAAAMERKWGIGRLRLLVTDLLRAKFDAQAQKFDRAIESGLEAEVQKHGDGMRKGWQALDRAATEAGHKPLAAEVWEAVLPSTGEVVAIVRTEAEAGLVAREGQAVYTLEEIGRLLDGSPTIQALKKTFPGSIVGAVHAKPSIDWTRGDPIPFAPEVR